MTFAKPQADSPQAPNPYLEMRLKTAGSLELTAIMYDVLIASIERATHALDEGRIEDRVQATNRAVSALVELRCALDMDQGGELARSLDRLYAYGLASLTGTALEELGKTLSSLQSVFAPLRDAWHQAAEASDEQGTTGDAAREVEPALSEATA